MISLEQKVEELHSRVTALEARLDGRSSSANLQSRVMTLEARLDEGSSGANPCSSYVSPRGYLNLLTSGIPHGIQVTPPTYPNLSDYQASLDVFQSRPS